MSEEILAKGRFRVDRKRALEKMERFQLADPLAYTLELVAAAVSAGATRIDVENDSDDFVLRWDGAGPTREELDGLFDHLFGASGPRGAMLQHLAMGILGALGQGPKWVHVDRAAAGDTPALRLSVSDPAETRSVEHAHDAATFPGGGPGQGGAGTRVHVRQRFSLANLAEALFSGRHVGESRLLRAKAAWCPVPLVLDGVPVEAPVPDAPLASWPVAAPAGAAAAGAPGTTGSGTPAAPAAPAAAGTPSAAPGALWLVAGAHGRVDLVRNGVTVESVERAIGPLRVTGWLRADTVELDASRAAIVRDAAWDGLERVLDNAVTELLVGAAGTLGAGLRAPGDEGPEHGGGVAGGFPPRPKSNPIHDPGLPLTRDAAVALARASDPAERRAGCLAAALWLAGHRRGLGPYAALPLLVDLEGRTWSVRDLQAFEGKKGTVADAALAEVGAAAVLFPLTMSATLDALAPGLPDLTTWLRAVAEGRARRRRAESAKLPPEFPPHVHQRRFEDGPLRGAVRFEGGESGAMRVSLRIGGVVVEEAHLPSPAGTMSGILDHPGFAPDDAFQHVLPDAIRAAAEARLHEEARAFATSHLERIVRGATLSPSGPTVLTAAVRAAGAKARTDLAGLLAARPDDPLLRAPALPCGDGRRLTLPEVLAGEWIVVSALPADCPSALAARVLVLPDDLAPTWLGWLGKRARDGRGTLAEEIRGALRRAAPRREAKLAIDGIRVPVALGARVGELGIEGSAAVARVDLLRAGIPVCTLTPALAMPGIVGVLDDPTFPVNAAHDALADEGVATRVLRDLAPVVDALARALWDAAPTTRDRPPPPPVLAWLAARGDALPDWARDLPLVYGEDGAAITAAALRARAADKRAARLKLLSKPPGDLPGFDDAIVAGPALRKALLAVGGRAVRDADPDLADAGRALATYLARPVPPTPPALIERWEQDDDGPSRLTTTPTGTPEKLRCRWILPLDPDRAGVLRVEARWRGRVLSTWERGESLGLVGILEGPAVTPNAALSMLRDPNVLSAWYRHARSRFDDLVRVALDERFPAEEDVGRGDAEGGESGADLPSPVERREPMGASEAGEGQSRRLRRGTGRPERAPLPAPERAAWRAILARLDGANDRARSEVAVRDRIAKQPLFARLDGRVVSREEIAAAREAGPVYTVPADTPPGPADGDWYLLDEAWTGRALGTLAGRIPSGAAALLAWREGEARRKALAPREARVTVPALARVSIDVAGVRGEIALVPGDGVGKDGHADGLLVQPLAEGRPLDTLRLPFAAPAVAVVEGPAIRPDRAFRVWEPGEEWNLARAAILAAARQLAVSFAASAVGGGAAPARPIEPGAHRWLVRYALGELGAAPGAADALSGAELPVFPLLGGRRASARELARRAELGGVGIVDPNTHLEALVASAPPVLAPPWMRELLATRFDVVDLVAIVARHRSARTPAAPSNGTTFPEGRLGWTPGPDAVDVLRGGVVLATVPAGGLVPITGFVHADNAEVDPVWRGLLPGPVTDALRARLTERAGAVFERLLADLEASAGTRGWRVGPPQRGVLLGALARVLDGAPNESALRADPLVARLLALPLFTDAAGAAGSFDAVLARSPIRWVEPGVVGDANPARGRVWMLPAAERALFQRLRPLVDATEALRAETRGAARRAAARVPPPATPPGAMTVALPEPLAGVLWLTGAADGSHGGGSGGGAGGGGLLGTLAGAVGAAGALGGAGVQVRIGGSALDAPLAAPVPGLAGWVEGPFDTDDAFTEVKLDASVNIALRGAAAELLQREIAAAPHRARARFSEALASVGHDHDALLDRPLSPWELVPLLTTTNGEPLDLRALVRMRKGAKRLLVGPEGATGTRRGERVVLGDLATLALLRGWFPGTAVEHVTEAEARAAERKRDEAARSAAGARGKHARAFVDRAGKLWHRWTGVRAPEEALIAIVEAWATGGRPGWPPFAEAELEGPWAALVAFAAEAPGEPPDARLARVAGLARALEEAGFRAERGA